jgi:N-acetylmuramoyl-L-alanine amidase
MMISASQTFTSRLRSILFFAIILLCFSILVAVPTRAADSPVKIVVGGNVVPFVVSPFMGSDGQVYAPVDVIHKMGASYVPNADRATVTVTSAHGDKQIVPYKFIQDRYCIPIQKIADGLGASATWDAPSSTLTLRARLELVRQEGDNLSIYTSYPVYYNVNKLSDPDRVYVDLDGLDLAAAPSTIPSTSPNASYIRSGRMDFNKARIVVDLKHKLDYKVTSSDQTNHIVVVMNVPGHAPVKPHPTSIPGVPQATIVAVPPPGTPPTVGQNPGVSTNSGIAPLPVTNPDVGNVPGQQQDPIVIPPNALIVTDVSFSMVSDSLVQVAVKTNGAAEFHTTNLSSPTRIALDLTNAALADSVSRQLNLANPVIKGVRSGMLNVGGQLIGRIVVDLARVVDFSVDQETVDGGIEYFINLRVPTQSPPTSIAGQLSGKIVMIDPGHGAEDTGALGIGGIREKDLNLSIAKKVRDVMIQTGATVYMTREDDIKPSVPARPQMAIAAHADYFISIHCDESGARNSHSGSTVYYHAHNAICKALAADISIRVAAVSGIPALGTKSDTIRFQTGFGVLRGSPMPAVLVECGYMNSEKDLVRLRNMDIQEKIAEGIVAGLVDFAVDRSRQ